jgi:UDP-N-acetylmuramoylalanine-D-glutamate ligase
VGKLDFTFLLTSSATAPIFCACFASPDIAIVTNTLDAHIGEFGGFNNLVKAKGEIYSNHSKNIFSKPCLISLISIPSA